MMYRFPGSVLRLLFHAVMVFVVIATLQIAARAVPGGPDLTFSGDGKVNFPFFKYRDEGYSTVVQPDGKVLIAGRSRLLNGFSIVTMARFETNGTLDTTFSRAGRMDVQFVTSESCGAFAIALQPDGKIVMAGYSGTDLASNLKLVVARFFPNGSLDSTFSDNGWDAVSVGPGFVNSVGTSIAVQSNGRIVAGGYGQTDTGLNRVFALVRYLADGTPDVQFDFDGIATTDIPNEVSDISSIALQSDGKIVAVGASAFNGVVARYTTNGQLDTTFSGDGLQTLQCGNDLCDFNAVDVQSDGKIVVGGTYDMVQPTEMLVVRYTTSGVLDTTFSGDGIVRTPVFTNVYGRALKIQADGKVLLAGFSTDGTDDFAVVRYTSTGTLDTTFNGTGIISRVFSNIVSQAEAVAFRSDGKIIVGGYTTRPLTDIDLAVVQFNTNGTLDTSFNGGEADTPGAISRDSVVKTAVQADGKILVAGNGSDLNDRQACIARLNVNGTLDTTFRNTGIRCFDHSVNLSDAVAGLAIQPDGKILLAGTTNVGPRGDFFITRLLSNGETDSSFGTGNGTVISQVSLEDASALAMKLQPDGRIVLVGHLYDGDPTRILIARYTGSGVLDPTFSGDGIAFGPADVEILASDVELQTDGKIVVGGLRMVATTSTDRDLALVRFNASGSLDTSFGIGGLATMSTSTRQEEVNAIAIQSDGKIVACGRTDLDALRYSIVLARFNTNGSSDGSVITTPPSTGRSLCRDIAIASSGKMLVGAYIDLTGGEGADFSTLRYSSSGVLDPLFGTQGISSIDFPNFSANVNSIAVQPNGRLVMAGSMSSAFEQIVAVGRSFAEVRPQIDFDGDGKTDLAVTRPSNGVWYLLNSQAGFSAYQFGFSTDVLTPADFTGDGKTDLAVWRPSNATWFVLRSEDNTFYGAAFGTAGDIPAPGDYDGDGKADLVEIRPSPTQSVWYLQQSTAGFAALPFGLQGDVPTIGDYDGDGKNDVAVYRPSAGAWFRFNSSDGSFLGVGFGQAGDKVVPADYTGDGKTDIAIFRTSNNIWYILRSEDFSLTGGAFGAAGDRPSPGDYDGDGKADLAVWRPGATPTTQSVFYLQQSTSGFAALPWGLGEDRPVPGAYVY